MTRCDRLQGFHAPVARIGAHSLKKLPCLAHAGMMILIIVSICESPADYGDSIRIYGTRSDRELVATYYIYCPRNSRALYWSRNKALPDTCAQGAARIGAPRVSVTCPIELEFVTKK
jgi:hypothetical protein